MFSPRPKRFARHIGVLLLPGLILFLPSLASAAVSASLPTDRGRIAIASIPDPYGGPNLKVLRTDANSPLRAGTAWIWEKQGQ